VASPSAPSNWPWAKRGERKQFKRPIGPFKGLRSLITGMDCHASVLKQASLSSDYPQSRRPIASHK